MKKMLFSLLFLSFGLIVTAQEGAAELSRQATGLRAEGKIYVVMAVVLTILAGVIIYLVRIDKKISRMEKKS